MMSTPRSWHAIRRARPEPDRFAEIKRYFGAAELLELRMRRGLP
jgi:hypothetical protein